MQPSSLIFLVIIAIWAAYLLQHWIRRREHLVTARSIDRFSEAMRVLERRTALTEATMSAPSPRSYAVSPARPSRPEVVVKRAQPSVASSRVAAAPVPSGRTSQTPGGLSGRRLRGLSLLASLALLVVVTPLALLGAVPGVSVLLTLAVLVLDLAWLRRAAQVERAGRRTTTRPARRVREQAAPTARPATATATAARETRTAPAAPAAASAQDTEDAEDGERPYDVQGAQAEAAPVKAAVDTVSGTGWQPVPVPPPTYTLKAKAPAPVPAPVVVEAPPVEMDELVQRRRAAGA